MIADLKPYPAMKDSGVEWLGEVPEHWEVVPLKFLCRLIQNGATPPTSEKRYYENGTVPWFGPSSAGAEPELGSPVRRLAEVAFTDGKSRLIYGPAVLVIVIGATVGKMGLLVGVGSTNQQITAFEIRAEKLVPRFAIQQLRSSENWLKSTASTATIPILDSGVVNRLPVAFPSCDEQQSILSAISKHTQPLNTTINRIEREIDLLREYRTRLIADVVTGKLDVRAAAANLPDEPDELELDNEIDNLGSNENIDTIENEVADDA